MSHLKFSYGRNVIQPIIVNLVVGNSISEYLIATPSILARMLMVECSYLFNVGMVSLKK